MRIEICLYKSQSYFYVLVLEMFFWQLHLLKYFLLAILVCAVLLFVDQYRNIIDLNVVESIVLCQQILL